MLENELKGIANWRTKRQQFFKVSSPWLDDHPLKKGGLESVGELSPDACTWHEVGDQTFLWSVNKLARSVTKWTGACDRRLARLISYIHHTIDYRQYCHVETRLSIVDWAFSKTQILLATLRTQKSTSGGILCIFGSQTFAPISWMCKKQRQYPLFYRIRNHFVGCWLENVRATCS